MELGGGREMAFAIVVSFMGGDMRARVFMAATVLTGLACSNNKVKTDETAVQQDSARVTPAYREPSRDTSATASSDSANGNQTKSGVTDTKTGKSTLGPGVTKTRPDQGQPVTSKGDTIGSSGRTGSDSSNTGSNSPGTTGSSDSTRMSGDSAAGTTPQ